MKKSKSITLLTIISVIMAVVIVFTFIKFPVGMKNYNGVLGSIETDYDISGGTAYTLTLSDDNLEPITDDNIDEVVGVLEQRMQTLGYNVFSVKALKQVDSNYAQYDVRIEARARTNKYGEPNLQILSSDIAIVAKYGELELYGGTEANPTTRILQGEKVIKSAKAEKITMEGVFYFQTLATLTNDAYEYLKEQIDAGTYYLEIRLGDDVLLSGANPLTAIENKQLALGTSTPSSDADTLAQYEAQAKQTSLLIQSAGLNYKFDISDGVEVSSPYGEKTELTCVLAIASLLLIAIVLSFVLFKGFGIISSLSLILFMLGYMWLLIGVPNVVVSIGGVIGIALALLLTANGLNIIGKKINEEFSNNKTIKASFNSAFKYSLKPIVSEVVVSAIVAILLFIFGKGILASMAVTFGIGLVVSAITTLGISRMFASLILPLAKNNKNFLHAKKEAE